MKLCEYELPREVRTVRVNILKARRSLHANINNVSEKASIDNVSQLLSPVPKLQAGVFKDGFTSRPCEAQKCRRTVAAKICFGIKRGQKLANIVSKNDTRAKV
mmetsp:Transcript_24244/g.24686  ORF Transcript_24244/g.24686 Transcript_24244/m.24686 type:complete len:103 (-) Transcript_24244:322-630(-)